ncbi:MAG: 4a-hydroxytetrahydrobiopterin dehydratase [Hyphomicrobiaceae bacterium]|jgi:4a-hydroxytetrahydrobiopterin dehydratase
MSKLLTMKCKPCRAGIEALAGDALSALAAELDGWDVIAGHHLAKQYGFDDFAGALGFVNRLAVVAESEGHHPNISFTWGKVAVEVFTHDIDGLSDNDFILAAKIDAVL